MRERARPNRDIINVPDERMFVLAHAVLPDEERKPRLEGDVRKVVRNAVEIAVPASLIETYHAICAARPGIENPFAEIEVIDAEIVV